MAFVSSKEKEEGLACLLLLADEGFALSNPGVGQIFVTEAGGMAAGVKSDAADAVMNGAVVAVRPVHLEAVSVGDASWVIICRLLGSNPERIGRVEVFHAMVFDKDLRYAVIGCR